MTCHVCGAPGKHPLTPDKIPVCEKCWIQHELPRMTVGEDWGWGLSSKKRRAWLGEWGGAGTTGALTGCR